VAEGSVSFLLNSSQEKTSESLGNYNLDLVTPAQSPNNHIEAETTEVGEDQEQSTLSAAMLLYNMDYCCFNS